jgi:hypothetical protein
MASDNFLSTLTEKYPFLTILSYAGHEYVGIVQNHDDSITTLYNYGLLIDTEDKETFLELGSQWWWESNRMIPINIFLKQEWAMFKPIIITLISKDLTVIHGPTVSLAEIAKRRSKRKSITLVKRISN